MKSIFFFINLFLQEGIVPTNIIYNLGELYYIKILSFAT
jgi:hypothetical protein